jgi:DNA-binding transcriptional regulator YdaS (Cro superfamily)
MGIEADLDSPLAEAVRRAGSQSAFARIVGRNQATVYGWLSKDKPLPAELVETVEKATGIARHVLRPDLPWSPPPPAHGVTHVDQPQHDRFVGRMEPTR